MHLGDEAIDFGEHGTVLNSNQHRRLVVARGCTFQFHRVGARDETRAGHLHDPIRDGVVLGLAHIEHATGLVQQERVAVFVEHVGRDRVRQASIARIQRLHLEGVASDTNHHAAGPGIERALATALRDLAGVPRGADAHAPQQRQGSEHGRVGSAATEDDVGTSLERSHVGLRPHQRHDAVAARERGRVDRRNRGERLDSTLPCQVDHRGDTLLGVEQGDARVQALFQGDLEGDVAHPVQCIVAAGGAAGADQQGNARGGLRAHQDGEVALDGVARIFGVAGCQISRAAVGRTRVAGDSVCARGNTRGQIGFAHAGAERSGGHENIDGVDESCCHGRT